MLEPRTFLDICKLFGKMPRGTGCSGTCFYTDLPGRETGQAWGQVRQSLRRWERSAFSGCWPLCMQETDSVFARVLTCQVIRWPAQQPQDMESMSRIIPQTFCKHMAPTQPMANQCFLMPWDYQSTRLFLVLLNFILCDERFQGSVEQWETLVTCLWMLVFPLTHIACVMWTNSLKSVSVCSSMKWAES